MSDIYAVVRDSLRECIAHKVLVLCVCVDWIRLRNRFGVED